MNYIKSRLMAIYRKIKAYNWWSKFKKERSAWVQTTIKEYSGNDRYAAEIEYLKKYGADYFPYDWSRSKGIMKIKSGGFRSGTDDEPYVIHEGKRLYMDLRAYSQLLLEQNIHSPHRYFTNSFNAQDVDVFVDVGGAEGMISLDVVNAAKKIIILECDEFWINNLGKTFGPWNEKVQIINKFAADYNDEKHITLDSLLKGTEGSVFIKMDVEGMEDAVLSGAQETLQRKNIKVAICTYHKEGDDVKFEQFFRERGFETEFSKGYMAMVNDNETNSRFRKAMLRCWK